MGFADTPQPDDTGDRFEVKRHYKYYIYANSIPVRAMLTAHERWVGTEVPDKETGEFKESEHLVRILNDEAGEMQEVTKEEFYKKCDEYLAYWTPERIEDSKKGLEQFQKLIDEGFFDDA